MFVSVGLTGRDFFLEGLFVRDTAVQALGRQDGEFGFGLVAGSRTLGNIDDPLGEKPTGPPSPPSRQRP